MNRSSSDSGCVVVLLAVIVFIILFGRFQVEVKPTLATTPVTTKSENG